MALFLHRATIHFQFSHATPETLANSAQLRKCASLQQLTTKKCVFLIRAFVRLRFDCNDVLAALGEAGTASFLSATLAGSQLCFI